MAAGGEGPWGVIALMLGAQTGGGMSNKYEVKHKSDNWEVYVRDTHEDRVLSWDEVEDLLNAYADIRDDDELNYHQE